MKISAADDKAINALLAKIAEHREEVEQAISKANDARSELFEMLDGIAADAESHFEEKSEKWQEGDNGVQFADWKDKLREAADGASEEFPEYEFPDWVIELEEMPRDPKEC